MSEYRRTPDDLDRYRSKWDDIKDAAKNILAHIGYTVLGVILISFIVTILLAVVWLIIMGCQWLVATAPMLAKVATVVATVGAWGVMLIFAAALTLSFSHHCGRNIIEWFRGDR